MPFRDSLSSLSDKVSTIFGSSKSQVPDEAMNKLKKKADAIQAELDRLDKAIEGLKNDIREFERCRTQPSLWTTKKDEENLVQDLDREIKDMKGKIDILQRQQGKLIVEQWHIRKERNELNPWTPPEGSGTTPSIMMSGVESADSARTK